MDDVITLNYHISPDDFTRAGEASSDVKGKLKQMGVSPDAVRKVAIAMYEGEAHACSKAQRAHFVRSRGISGLHGQRYIRDSGTHVRQDHLDLFLLF